MIAKEVSVVFKKLIHIKNYGRFSNFYSKNSDWDGSFKKINVIYAPNGSGKTTLAELFRSTQGDCDVVTKKQTFGASQKPEIKFMLNYINLMKVRFPEDIVDINLDIPSEPSMKTKVPPLLFMPLIENAFKHGVSYVTRTVIDLSIRDEKDYVMFECTNTLPASAAMKTREGGIGLDNVRRRLDILYGDENLLETSQKDNIYKVRLTIPKI